MNKKGFTLIELLIVIIILAMLVSIISISVEKVIKNSKKQLSETQIKTIEEAANIYYIKEGINNSNNNRSFKLCVNLNYLIEMDYIEDEDITNLKSDDKLDGSVEITYYSEQYTYKYKENRCTYTYKVLDQICRAVTNDTKTTGNIPNGEYLPGDEYICKVNDDEEYHFFVISTENDNVNLIMDRNIYYDEENDVGEVATAANTGLVAWYDAYNKSYGPVTAMTYLHNATKDWNNVPNMIMNYDDENIDAITQEKGTSGYGSIKTTGNMTIITSKNNKETGRIENLKTRMPRYDEVHGQGKCATSSWRCPLWLANYLEFFYGPVDGLQNINEILGYWTLSTSDDHPAEYAWAVYFIGYVGTNGVFDANSYGVRPVISIPKLDIAN